MAQRIRETAPAGRRDGWLGEAIGAGFVATVAMSILLVVAFVITSALGAPEATGLPRWFWALTHNPIVEFTIGSLYLLVALHLVFGIVWAVLYAAVFEPRLPGPGWQRGVLFSLLPWLGSLLVFLPLAGAGPLGLRLGAGPLPTIGNLVLHLAYGGVLGALYTPARRPARLEAGALADDLAEQLASMLRAEHGVAVGMGVGGALGLAVGFALGLLFPSELLPAAELAFPLVGLVLGAALGALVGSMVFIYRSPSSQRQ